MHMVMRVNAKSALFAPKTRIVSLSLISHLFSCVSRASCNSNTQQTLSLSHPGIPIIYSTVCYICTLLLERQASKKARLFSCDIPKVDQQSNVRFHETDRRRKKEQRRRERDQRQRLSHGKRNTLDVCCNRCTSLVQESCCLPA